VLPVHDLHNLEAYFGPSGAACEHSPFGAMLERASVLHRDSSGHITVAPRIGRAVRELEGSTVARPRLAEVVTGWAHRKVRHEQGQGIETEDRDDALQLVARVSRRLRQLPGEVQRVLGLLYGDAGCRWQRQTHGRLWALVPEQPAARRALDRDDQDRTAKGRPAAELQPAERLAMLGAGTPRPAWVGAALDGAERQQSAADRAWLVTGTERHWFGNLG
jgi:hypothetical protein